jgi:WD40 repeat protein
MMSARLQILSILLLLAVSAQAAYTQLQRPELVVQTGHTAIGISAVAVNPDGTSVASGGTDGRVKIWNLSTLREVRSLGSGAEPVTAVTFSGDGKYVAVASRNILTVTEVLSGHDVAHVPVGRHGALRIAFSSDGRWLAWDDGLDIRMWNLPQDVRLWSQGPTSGALRTLPAPVMRRSSDRAWVSALAFSHDGRWLASGYSEGSVTLWAVTGEHQNYRLIDEPGLISSIAFSPDDSLFATGSASWVSIWRVGSRTPLRTLKDVELVRAVDFETAATVVSITCGDVDRRVRASRWEVATGKPVGSLETSTWLGVSFFELTGEWPVAFEPGGRFLAFASDSTTIRVWGLRSAERSADLGGSTTAVGAVAVDSDKHWLAVGSGSEIQLWNLNNGEQSNLVTGYQDRIRSLEFSKDGRLLVSAAGNGEVDVWDLLTRQRKGGLHGHYRFVYGDGARIASSGANGSVRLVEIASQRETTVETESQPEIARIGVSTDGTLVASGSQLFSSVQVWKASGGPPIWKIRTHFTYDTELRFSRDNRYLAWGEHGGGVVVLDIVSGRTLNLCCHGDRWASAVEFSRDGDLLFSGGNDHQIRVWNLARAWAGDTRELHRLEGHTGDVRSLALSQDGTLLVSGSDDGTARLWDLSTWQERADLISMTRRPLWLVVTPEGLFDGVADAIGIVSWRIVGTNDVFPLDAFYNDYFHPGLAAEIFGGRHPTPCMDIAALLRVPGVQTMRRQRMLHTEVQDGRAVLCLPDRPDPSVFEGVDARVKGLPVPVDPSKFHRGTTEGCLYALDLPAAPEQVEINSRLSPAALSCRRMPESAPIVPCTREPSEKPNASVLHVQTVAVTAYPPSSNYSRLEAAVGDARALEAFFREKKPSPGDSYKRVRVWPGLQDGDARLDAIVQRFAAMAAEVAEDDVVLLFLSGHGRVPPGQEMFYFLPVDGKADAEADTGLSTAMLVDFIRSLRARRVILFIDACQSGGALDSLVKVVEAKAEVDRRIPPSSNGRDAPKQSGMHMVAASIPFQLAKTADGADPFAKALLEKLGAPGSSSRSICAQDVSTYIVSQVSKALESVANQLPLAFSQGADFVIVGK